MIRRRQAGPAWLYSALSAAMVLLLGTVALTAAAPPPPAIAEFAPEAVQQITDAPEEQEQLAVRGPGQGPGGEADDADDASPDAGADAASPSAGPVASALPIHRVARAHTCVGSPPRQTEDLQSPPCVAFYEGELLGATSRGVTAEEVRIVIPCQLRSEPRGGSCQQDGSLDIKAFTAFFNERFEFYGRKLKVIRYEISRPLTVTNMIADAQAIEALEPFAVLDYQGGATDFTGTTAVFFRELARRKIVNISGLQLEAGTSNVTQGELQAQAPYSWTYQPTADMVLAQIGDLICTSLVGRKPYFDVEQNAARPEPSVRKFGIAVPQTPESSGNLDIAPLTTRLDGCGAPYQAQVYTPKDPPPEAAGAVSKFHADGVTTVVMLGGLGFLNFHFQQNATKELWYPEWITNNIYGLDAMVTALNTTGTSREQNSRMFGLRSGNKAKTQVKTYNYQAVKEYDSNYTCCDRRGFYQGFLLLASGVQMAGPNLTPQTFQQGLYDADFPGNATAGAAPDWQARVDFGPGDHTMQGDFGFQFVNQQETNNDFPTQQGAYCAVEQGIRFGPGQLRRPLTFFNAGRGMGSAPCLW